MKQSLAINELLFNIFFPIILLVIPIFYFFRNQNFIYYFFGLVILIFLSNALILIITFNKIIFKKDKLIIIKGLIFKKTVSLDYKNIKYLYKTGLPRFHQFDAIIPLNGISYNPKRDKIRIHKGYINNNEFLKFEKELNKKINSK